MRLIIIALVLFLLPLFLQRWRPHPDKGAMQIYNAYALFAPAIASLLSGAALLLFIVLGGEVPQVNMGAESYLFLFLYFASFMYIISSMPAFMFGFFARKLYFQNKFKKINIIYIYLIYIFALCGVVLFLSQASYTLSAFFVSYFSVLFASLFIAGLMTRRFYAHQSIDLQNEPAHD